VNPPHFYVSHEQIEETRRAAATATATVQPTGPPSRGPLSAVMGIPPVSTATQQEAALTGKKIRIYNFSKLKLTTLV
jgi:hypothetical protein